MVGGALSGKVVKFIHAGYRHSAAVTEEGELGGEESVEQNTEDLGGVGLQ